MNTIIGVGLYLAVAILVYILLLYLPLYFTIKIIIMIVYLIMPLFWIFYKFFKNNKKP
jgi:hypothetical protein